MFGLLNNPLLHKKIYQAGVNCPSRTQPKDVKIEPCGDENHSSEEGRSSPPMKKLLFGLSVLSTGLLFCSKPADATVIAPLLVEVAGRVPGPNVQVGKVALPELSPQQWRMLLQQQGAEGQRLHIAVGFGVDNGRVSRVSVRKSYPDVDRAIVHWITTNWKLAPWFVGQDHFVVSFEVDPALRQVVFSRARGISSS